MSRRVKCRERDVACGQNVLLNKGRRDLQGGGDVVEALRRVVWRQQFGAVDLDRKQITDSVFVLLAIQLVQHNLIGDECLGRNLVERRFEPRDQRVDRLAVRLLRRLEAA